MTTRNTANRGLNEADAPLIDARVAAVLANREARGCKGASLSGGAMATLELPDSAGAVAAPAVPPSEAVAPAPARPPSQCPRCNGRLNLFNGGCPRCESVPVRLKKAPAMSAVSTPPDALACKRGCGKPTHPGCCKGTNPRTVAKPAAARPDPEPGPLVSAAPPPSDALALALDAIEALDRLDPETFRRVVAFASRRKGGAA